MKPVQNSEEISNHIIQTNLLALVEDDYKKLMEFSELFVILHEANNFKNQDVHFKLN